MSDAMALPWGALAVGTASGMLLAVLYLFALARAVRGLTRARAPGRRLMLGSLLRVLLTGAGFGGVLVAGGTPALLAAVAGFMLIRTLGVRWRTGRGMA